MFISFVFDVVIFSEDLEFGYRELFYYFFNVKSWFDYNKLKVVKYNYLLFDK